MEHPGDRETFADIIVDFRYFDKAELIEHTISSSEVRLAAHCVGRR
jgi:hypothetical protein